MLPVLDSLFCYCSGKPHNEPNYGSVGPELHNNQLRLTPMIVYVSQIVKILKNSSTQYWRENMGGMDAKTTSS